MSTFENTIKCRYCVVYINRTSLTNCCLEEDDVRRECFSREIFVFDVKQSQLKKKKVICNFFFIIAIAPQYHNKILSPYCPP